MGIFAAIGWILLAVANRYFLIYYIKRKGETGKVENFFLFFLYVIPPVGTLMLAIELASESTAISRAKSIFDRVQRWLKGEL